MTNRDEFTAATKRTLAERVAWCCSFPNCGAITIGPKQGDAEKSLNLGEAAHMHAASPNGPRYDPDMSSAERSSIENGIWMCRSHGTFIDSDHTEYSAATLRLWKGQAEERAYQDLMHLRKVKSPGNRTLVAFGLELIAFCRWKSVQDRVWKFEIDSFLKGDAARLRAYVTDFSSLGDEVKFIVVESQGDAREIQGPVRLESADSGDLIAVVNVSKRFEATDPNTAGSDLALAEDGDLIVENGDLRVVSGMEAAIQHLTTATATVYGSWWGDRMMGSFASEYYHGHRSDLPLLGRLFKMEFIRLSLIPTSPERGKADSIPTLHFINRIERVAIASADLHDHKIEAEITLEWGNGEKDTRVVPIWIDDL